MGPTREDIDVGDLLLDPENPRLPEHLHGADQVELLTYLHENSVLDELIRSLDDNGFFQHEPLIGVRDADKQVVVLEGNRRLAALKIYAGAPEAKDLGLTPELDAAPSAKRLRELATVPVYVVGDREEVHRYLGFRHIGGIKTWPAEAKARYLMQESDRAAERRVSNPFLDVARRVGSNSQGVRNSYTAIFLLHHARDEYGLKVDHIVQRRFGVWLRCMTSDVRYYIGLNGARSYEEVRQHVEHVKEPALREVLTDLTPRGERRAVLADSRDVTVYGQVLMHDDAREVLRRYEDLQVARQIVEAAALPARIRDLRDRVDVAREEAQRSEFSEDLMESADELWASVRSLRGTIRELDPEGQEQE
jgi:hypothetical protein